MLGRRWSIDACQLLMTCVVVATAMQPSPCGARGRKRLEQGEERHDEEAVRYLLREFWVVQGGLKDASGKDWKRDKGTTR